MRYTEVLNALCWATISAVVGGAVTAGTGAAGGALGAVIGNEIDKNHLHEPDDLAQIAVTGNAILATSTFFVMSPALRSIQWSRPSLQKTVNAYLLFFLVIELGTILGYLINPSDSQMEYDDVIVDTALGTAILTLPIIFLLGVCTLLAKFSPSNREYNSLDDESEQESASSSIMSTPRSLIN
jgi:hypothetical protein